MDAASINSRIALAVNPDGLIFCDDGQPAIKCGFNSGNTKLDYCGDWSLLMPLVVKYRIGFDPDPSDNNGVCCWSNAYNAQLKGDDHKLMLAKMVMFLCEFEEADCNG